MHTCSCGAVFEFDEPHCQQWSALTISDRPAWDTQDARDVHNVDGPLTPGLPCRRLNPSHSAHHARPMERTNRLAFGGQVATVPATDDAHAAGMLWTTVVLLSGLTTLVAACLHYLS